MIRCPVRLVIPALNPLCLGSLPGKYSQVGFLTTSPTGNHHHCLQTQNSLIACWLYLEELIGGSGVFVRKKVTLFEVNKNLFSSSLLSDVTKRCLNKYALSSGDSSFLLFLAISILAEEREEKFLKAIKLFFWIMAVLYRKTLYKSITQLN